MTTSEPSLAQEIHAAAQAKRIHAVDAPITGGDVGAREGTLSIMVGGDTDTVAQIQPLLQLIGKTVVYQGGPGNGQHAKLCNQIVIAGTMIGVCESLLYGHRAGLNLEAMLQSIRSGGAACWTLDNLAPRILKKDFEPGFLIDHFVKDLGIALAQAQRMNLILPGLQLAYELYHIAQEHRLGKRGTQALYLALETISKRLGNGQGAA